MKTYLYEYIKIKNTYYQDLNRLINIKIELRSLQINKHPNFFFHPFHRNKYTSRRELKRTPD